MNHILKVLQGAGCTVVTVPERHRLLARRSAEAIVRRVEAQHVRGKLLGGRGWFLCCGVTVDALPPNALFRQTDLVDDWHNKE